MKVALPLALALLVSVALNIALLRREPTAAVPQPAPAPAVPAPEIDADQILLREEVRVLRNQLTVAKSRRELDRSVLGFPVNEPGEQPDTRDFQELMELVQSCIEGREVELRHGQHHHGKGWKQVLTPENRNRALRAIEDYLGLNGAARLSFHEGALSAIVAYHGLLDTYNRETSAASKASDHDEFFEDAGLRQQAVMDRLARNQDEWMRTHVQPIQAFLDRRDGVRPSLLSDQLSSLLMQLGTPDER